jgi:uncharacterized protein
MIEISEKDLSVTFKVRVQPRASRTEIVGEHAGGLKLRIASPPVEGRANEECRRFLAKALGVPASSVEIIGGDLTRDKIIRVHNISAAQVRESLTPKG